MGYPWSVLHGWEPFHIDALGLITLLGSEEVNNYIGRLVSNRWLEYMPLLGAFVIAGDRFKEKTPSFNIYNITSGINTSELSSWFTRWMLAQDFQVTRSVVYWEIIADARTWWPYHLIAGSISFCFTGLLIAMAVLSKDWYGLANASAIAISIFVRAYILQANRNAINTEVLTAKPLPGTYEYAKKQWDEQPGPDPQATGPQEGHRPDENPWKKELATILIVMSDAKAVTMYIPEQVIIPVFVNNTKPSVAWLYDLCKWVGWAAFAVQIVAIGLTKLASQMFTVALLVIPTVLVCWKIGCDDSSMHRILRGSSGQSVKTPYECWIGSHLKATVYEWPDEVEFGKRREGGDAWDFIPPVAARSTRRQDLYAWLNLTAEEEDSLGKWDLLPHTRNNDVKWASDFTDKKALIRDRPPNVRAIKDVNTEIIKGRRLHTRLLGGKRNQGDVELSSRATSQQSNPLEPKAVQRVNTTISTSGIPTSSPPTPTAELEPP